MNKTKRARICVILTGGTICSVPDDNGKNHSDAGELETVLSGFFKNDSLSKYKDDVLFDHFSLKPDILSENMTVHAWHDILKIFKEKVDLEKYRGIIVLHGTDTLAYTSSFLSLALAGIKIPVCLVSAQLILGKKEKGRWIREEKSNGYDNFCASVELIMNGIAPNVYAVYRNEKNEKNGKHEPGKFLVHYGAHLLQCPNASNNFHSRDEMTIPDITNAGLKGRGFETDACLYKNDFIVNDSVLLIRPYTSLNYARINLEGIKAIVHGTYHSESVCIGRAIGENEADNRKRDDYILEEIVKEDRNYSILYLLKECEKRGITVFLAPCDEEKAAYGTTANAIKRGAVPIKGITLECAYSKAVLGSALNLQGEDLDRFMKKSINYEL